MGYFAGSTAPTAVIKYFHDQLLAFIQDHNTFATV